MDKRIIFAVAGSGKTTYIVNSLEADKRSLIITYTNNNYKNIARKIANKFNGHWPENIALMTYFRFLYYFCYKPFLSDCIKARGISFNQNPNQILTQDCLQYYMNTEGYFYSNRLSLFLDKKAHILEDIKARIEKYFDEFIIDEIQDIAGRDFNFLELLMSAQVSMLFVGDFYQHTFDTSRDGTVNKNLFTNRSSYEKRFTSKGFVSDNSTLAGSWRCSKKICEFISEKLDLSISSNRTDENGQVTFVSDMTEIKSIISNPSIIKLYYKESYNYGPNSRNWGDTKGEDDYKDICVVLNKKTADLYTKEKLRNLCSSTKNKLYVAITRAHGNVYLVNEDTLASVN